jgi:multidrug efflux pump
MTLSDLSIRRPVFATVLNLLIIIIGLVAFSRLELREYPDIDPPIVSVLTLYTGASAQVIETRVTKILEDSISGIEGVRSIDSSSQDGISTISVEFTLGRNADEAASDVRDRVLRVVNQLPDEVEVPQISKVDANTQPIFWIAFKSQYRDGLELTDYATRYIRDQLSVVSGVSRVEIGGERRYAMHIWLDRDAMAARGITVSDIQQSLSSQNVELPAGRIESLGREFSVRVDRMYNNVEDFENLPLRRNDNGNITKLKDVAKVEKGAEDERTELHYNGISSIGLGIVKQSNANTLEVVQAVKAEMEKIKKTLPSDIVMETAFDSGLFIEGAVHEVYLTIFVTLALVVLVIWVFLGDIRATIIPSLAIPVSLIGAFIVLWALGFSINLLTLLALVLAIGLVVDDAIVVLENVYKRIEKGVPPLAAAQIGTKQVAFAVIATTLVLVAVFVPVSMMPGNSGRLFTEFAWAIIGAIVFSSITALSLTPMLCSQILKTHAVHNSEKPKVNRITKWVNKKIDSFSITYSAILDKLFKRPLMVVAFMFLVIALGIFFSRFINSEYAPLEDRGYFMVFMQGPEGASFEYTKRNLSIVENKLVELLPPSPLNDNKGSNEALGVVTIIPGSFDSTGVVNSAFTFVLMQPWSVRPRSVNEIVWGDFMAGTPGLFQNFMGIPGIMAFAIEPGSLGQSGFSQPVQFVLAGNDYQELAKWRDILNKEISSNTQIRNPDWDYKETKPQVRISIDTDKAADLGVSLVTIGSTLQSFMGSIQVTDYLDKGEQYYVILQGADINRMRATDMTGIYVRSERSGMLIPLSNLITYQEMADSGTLNRYNRLRAVTLQASLAPGYTLGQALDYLETTARRVLPSDARIDFKGESREYKESGAAIYLIFLFALVAVYLFLSAQFENWIHPFVIMMTVPLAVVGALWGLFLTNATLNIYTQIGLIMLVGLAAKNGILIVEFANQLRDEGQEFMMAIKNAAIARFRPILMTSVATVIGAVPLILATGPGAESRFPIGIVIFAGVLVSTFFTLFVVPSFYAMLAKHTKSPEYTGRKLEAELKALEK